jgi:outer membrane protein, heavy metal efflux system
MARKHIMRRSTRAAGIGAALLLAGCLTSDPRAKINESAALAGKRLGLDIDWNSIGPPQPVPEGAMLTREDAVARALRNNRDLRADIEFIGQADAELLQAGLLQNPVVNLMVMFPDGGGRAMLRGSGIPMQPLQDLWLIPARKGVATAELQQAVQRVAGRAISTAAEVQSVYVRLQYAQRSAALVRENLDVSDQATRLVQVRQEAGKATQVALNLARLRAMRQRAELVAAEAEYRVTQRELLELIGTADATDEWTVTALHELSTSLPAPGSESELVSVGLSQRLDLAAAQWTVRAAEERIGLRDREGWPELDLGLSFERAPAPAASGRPSPAARVGNAAAQAVTDRALGAPMAGPMVAPWSVAPREVTWTTGPMLNVEVPIFDQNQAQIAKARHELREQQERYAAQLQTATRDIRRAWVRQKEALEQMIFYRETIVPDVQRNLQLAQETFVAGQEGLLEYLQAQDDWIETRRTILAYMRDSLLARVELERAVGGRLDGAAAAAPAMAREMHEQSRTNDPGLSSSGQ